MYQDKFGNRQERDGKPEKKGQNGKDGSSYMYKTKKRVFDIIQIGNRKDFISSAFDIFIVVTIVLNLFVTLFQTFDESAPYANVLNVLELITILIFMYCASGRQISCIRTSHTGKRYWPLCFRCMD